MASETPLTPATRLIFGLLCIAAGALPLLAAFDVGPLHQRDINGPPWLAGVAGGIFVAAGLMLFAGNSARNHPLSYVLLFIFIGAFAAIGNWIAFGPGPRQCSGGFTAFMFSSKRAAAEWECRIAFGIGACIMDAILIWMLAHGLGKLAGPGRLADGLEKLGKGIFLLALSPILIPMFAFLIGKSALEGFGEYRRTGKWPRNEKFIARMKRKDRDAAG